MSKKEVIGNHFSVDRQFTRSKFIHPGFSCCALLQLSIFSTNCLFFLIVSPFTFFSAAKYNGDLYNKRRLMVELPAKGGLPLQPMGSMRPSMGTMSSMSPPMTTNPMASNPMTSNPMNPAMTQMAPMTSMTPMTSIMTSMTPMTSMGPLAPEPVATYITEMPSISSVSTLPTERHGGGGGGVGGGGGLKQNGQRPKGIHSHSAHSAHSHAHSHSSKGAGLGATSMAHMTGTVPGSSAMVMSRAAVDGAIGSGSGTLGHPLAFSSNTLGGAGPGMGLGLKGWDGTETVGRRKAYSHKRPQCTVLEQNQLHGTRAHSHSQHFLPTQPYFVTNSKTEVTV